MVKQLSMNEILNEDDRIFKSWATVDIVDRQGDRIPMGEFKKVMPIIMKRGGVLIDQHSNKPIGKILNYNFEHNPKFDAEGLKLMCQIYKDYKHDDEVWEAIKSGERTGLSFGGLNRKLEFDYSTDEPSKILKAIEGFEFSVVDKPANQGATIEEVNLIAKGEVMTTEERIELIEKQMQIIKEDLAKREEIQKGSSDKNSNIFKTKKTPNTMEEVTKQKPMEEKKPEMDMKKPEEENKSKKRYEMSEEDMVKALKAKGYMVSREAKKEESEEEEKPEEESSEPAAENAEAPAEESKEESISEDVVKKLVKEEVSKVLQINKAAETPLVDVSEEQGQSKDIKKFAAPKTIYEASKIIKQLEELKANGIDNS